MPFSPFLWISISNSTPTQVESVSITRSDHSFLHLHTYLYNNGRAATQFAQPSEGNLNFSVLTGRARQGRARYQTTNPNMSVGLLYPLSTAAPATDKLNIFTITTLSDKMNQMQAIDSCFDARSPILTFIHHLPNSFRTTYMQFLNITIFSTQ